MVAMTELIGSVFFIDSSATDGVFDHGASVVITGTPSPLNSCLVV